ncbi:hypothetical protein LCGC14_3025310 [marine sediment metagenome]|uniref:Uncharacterized protein n=1 Tax=marine sediment metagenome TaxID=412755 RepID=A0A0F8Z1M7_9ZZZZ
MKPIQFSWVYFLPQLALALGVNIHFAPWNRHVHLDLHLPIGILSIGTWRHTGDGI